MRFRLGSSRLALLSCQTVLALALFGCGDRGAADSAAFKKDQTAVATVSRIAAAINSTRTISSEDFAALKKIRERYPHSPEVANAYQGALIVRGDWTALEALLRERPVKDLSADEKLILGRVLVKTAKFEEAVDHLKAFSAENPKNLDIRGLLAEALQGSGRYDEAESQLSAVWSEAVAAKRVDLMVLRGSVLIALNRFENAEEVLRAAFAADPDSLAAAAGLSRVYKRLGNETKAEEFRLKASEIGDRIAERDSAARNRVERIHAIEAAWNARRYQEVISLCNELLKTSSDPNERLSLYQYIFESHKAVGNNVEAERARIEVLKLQQK